MRIICPQYVLRHVLISFALALCVSAEARADGVTIHLSDEGSRLVAESAQHAVISLRDGKEHLLLNVALDEIQSAGDHPQQLAWIIPVPCEAASVAASIVDGFPRFSQPREVHVAASEVLRTASSWMFRTQLWPEPAGFLFDEPKTTTVATSELSIHQSFERSGIGLEVVSASSVDAVAQHVRGFGAMVPADALRSLGTYVSAKQAFVIYRVADARVAKRAAGSLGLSVALDFPATSGFFPLVVSSSLPGAHVDVWVMVAGLVQPIEPAPHGLLVEHVVGTWNADRKIAAHLGLPVDRASAGTLLYLATSPSGLTRDLHFAPGASAGTRLASMIGMLPETRMLDRLWAGLWFSLVSVLAAFVARPIWAGRERPSYRTIALLGLLNAATVVAMLGAALYLATRLGVSRVRALVFTLCASCAFTALVFATTAVALAMLR